MIIGHIMSPIMGNLQLDYQGQGLFQKFIRIRVLNMMFPGEGKKM